MTKRQWGAFYGTDLDLQLRRRGVRTIVLGGIATSIGVESTARSAWEHGYELVICEDLCADLHAETHAFSFKHIFPAPGAHRDLGSHHTRMSAPGVSASAPTPTPRLGAWPPPLLWLSLLALSALISVGWGALGLPAALLLGPMVGGIVFGVNGARLAVPRAPYLGAQAVIGAMVSGSITPSILVTFSHQYVLFLSSCSAPCSAPRASAGSSADGSHPGRDRRVRDLTGCGGAMVVLGEAEGADARLVAFMQYSRVLLVAVAAALVARFGRTSGAPTRPPHPG